MSDVLFQKSGFPEENELVICTVTKIYPNSVFVNMDDYDKGGMIHISEVSPGRIRNIREFIKEGKVVICKVLRVNMERGHVDLSLRRVSAIEKKNIVNSRKQEQRAEKIIEHVATKVATTKDAMYAQFGKTLVERYGSLHGVFEAVVSGEVNLLKEGFDEKTAETLKTEIQQRIKPPVVTIGGEYVISSYQSDGVDLIKKTLIDATHGKENVFLNYLGAGRYQIEITSDEYKKAEGVLDGISQSIFSAMKKNNGSAEFSRVEKKKLKT
jgi:translation initiation factor 2 subunit 1